MMNRDFLARSMVNSATNVFQVMLGMDITPEDAYGDLPAATDAAKVVALIGIAGTWIGTGMISCSPDAACRVSSRMLMTPCDAVSEDVLDAMAEMANMIFGTVKTELEEQLGGLGLSIPTVIYGRNFGTRSVGQQSWTMVPIRAEEDVLELKICLVQNHEHRSEPRTHLRPYALLRDEA